MLFAIEDPGAPGFDILNSMYGTVEGAQAARPAETPCGYRFLRVDEDQLRLGGRPRCVYRTDFSRGDFGCVVGPGGSTPVSGSCCTQSSASWRPCSWPETRVLAHAVETSAARQGELKVHHRPSDIRSNECPEPRSAQLPTKRCEAFAPSSSNSTKKASWTKSVPVPVTLDKLKLVPMVRDADAPGQAVTCHA